MKLRVSIADPIDMEKGKGREEADTQRQLSGEIPPMGVELLSLGFYT
jgi:hypothetical protein